MRDNRTYDVLCLSKLLSPMTHNVGTEGNETLINREAVATPQGIRWVPVLSGNAIRHRMIRDPGARFLVDRWGLGGELTLKLAQFLFHGGSLDSSCPTESLTRIRTWWRLLPLIRILGGSLPDLIVGGAIAAWRGLLVCRENESRLRCLVPADWIPDGRLIPADRMIGRYQYTRQDAGRTVPDLVKESPAGLLEESGQMIYSGQQVNAGAAFLHGFRLRDATLVDLGCLLLSLALWQQDNATIGGQSAKGHGRLAIGCAVTPEVDTTAAMEAYAVHVESVKDEAVAWMGSQFSAKIKPAKSNKRKGRADGDSN